MRSSCPAAARMRDEVVTSSRMSSLTKGPFPLVPGYAGGLQQQLIQLLGRLGEVGEDDFPHLVGHAADRDRDDDRQPG